MQVTIEQDKTATNYDINDLDGEIWRPVFEFEQFYHVSNKGRVKRLESHRPKRNGSKTGKFYHVSEMIMKQYIQRNNQTGLRYYTVQLRRPGRRIIKTINNLMEKAGFI